VFSTNTQ
jgi:kinesin family member 5